LCFLNHFRLRGERVCLPQAFLSFIKAFGFDPKGPASPFKR